MNPDDAAHAFERFLLAEPNGTDPRRGTGLGLAITAELIAHHGTINLNTAPGHGASFTINLPSVGRAPEDTPSRA